MKKTFKNYYIHLFFIFLIVNFGFEMILVGHLNVIYSLIFASFFTGFNYFFDRLYSIDVYSPLFAYERFEDNNGKSFLRIKIHFDDPENLGINSLKRDYVKEVAYGIFGVAWGKPSAELKLIREMQKDLKKEMDEN